MLDVALLLCQILSKDMTFSLKSAHIKTALDLFLKINKISEFPNIKKRESENKHHLKSANKNYETYSRVVQSFRFKNKNDENQNKKELIGQSGVAIFRNNNNNGKKEDLKFKDNGQTLFSGGHFFRF